MSLAVPINIGGAPDDHTGDSLRAAFEKVNAGFAATSSAVLLLVAANVTALRQSSQWDPTAPTVALGPFAKLVFLLGNAVPGDTALRVFRWDAASGQPDDGVVTFNPINAAGQSNTGPGRFVQALLGPKPPAADVDLGDAQRLLFQYFWGVD